MGGMLFLTFYAYLEHRRGRDSPAFINNTNNYYSLGIDIGSTIVKIAIANSSQNMIFSDYERHFANIQETLAELLRRGSERLGPMKVHPATISSGGLTLSKHLEVSSVQEVAAMATALQDYAPQTDVAIELGGEDAEIICFTNSISRRMNGICAGGTGSFIDQTATLLQTDTTSLNEYAKSYQAIYPIATRCGVFAKSDVQPLINEGATKEDLSASIFQTIVNQTISGLTCDGPIRGNIALLGGLLHFLSELRQAFIYTLHLTGDAIVAPDHSHLFAALGVTMNGQEKTVIDLETLIDELSHGVQMGFEVKRMEPLFVDEDDYAASLDSHSDNHVRAPRLAAYEDNCSLGIDAGSITAKAALVGEDGSLLYDSHSNNNRSPLATTTRPMKEIRVLLSGKAHIT